MSDWTAGYVADIGYTFGYDEELNPLRARLMFLQTGLVPPEQGCHWELGFGQGLSVNIHAAASGSQWYGTDFNPSQAGFARSLARISGADARLSDEAFAEFCGRTDLPEFDTIGLHGIWSWINDENRAVIVDLVRRKLKVGGVLYISYNTQPGWAAMVPLRELLTQHAQVMGRSGQGIVSRIDDALEFAERLFAVDPAFARRNPSVAERLKTLKTQNRNYLAHEYFNRDWLPMSFARMAEWLARAKLSFACSAHYLDHIDLVNLTAQQQSLLGEISDPTFRETVRDFCVNQQFRRDYWVKGARALNPTEQLKALRALRVVLATPRPEVPLKLRGSLGEAVLQEAVYGPIVDTLADHRPVSLGELERRLGGNTRFAQLLQSVLVLAASDSVLSVQEDDAIARAQPLCDCLNVHVLDRARGSGEISYLASPLIGGGVVVPRFHQLFLLAMRQGINEAAAVAQFVWRVVSEQGQRLATDGKPLATAEENLAELESQARAFMQTRLPTLRALRLVA